MSVVLQFLFTAMSKLTLSPSLDTEILKRFSLVKVEPNNTHEKLENGWRDRGGLAGYSNHVKEIGRKFEYITVHPDIWTHDIPSSSFFFLLFIPPDSVTR
jgi:hypothetical protein